MLGRRITKEASPYTWLEIGLHVTCREGGVVRPLAGLGDGAFDGDYGIHAYEEEEVSGAAQEMQDVEYRQDLNRVTRGD
ncbi:hypothetical protein RJT34_17395 [Clitoria ternatea]|uniref:Uncharacterized protein n=1 Tax=Clitoria ternatea TaxID=43366 RepID=A0AAN9JA81_CLITE